MAQRSAASAFYSFARVVFELHVFWVFEQHVPAVRTTRTTCSGCSNSMGCSNINNKLEKIKDLKSLFYIAYYILYIMYYIIIYIVHITCILYLSYNIGLIKRPILTNSRCRGALRLWRSAALHVWSDNMFRVFGQNVPGVRTTRTTCSKCSNNMIYYISLYIYIYIYDI